MSFLDTVFGSGGNSTAQEKVVVKPDDKTGDLVNPDNNGDNIDNNKSYWDNEDPKVDDTPPVQKVEVVQQVQEKTPQEQMQEHVAGLNLTDGIDIEKIGEDLRNGDAKSLNEALSVSAGNAYTASMKQMNTLMDAKLEKVMAQAAEQSNAAVNTNLAISQMQQKLEFTKDPDIAPIAKAALAQAIKQGKDAADAIASVEAFFMKAAGNISKTMKPPQNSSGNHQFPAQNDNNNSNHASHDDWLNVLTGKTN